MEIRLVQIIVGSSEAVLIDDICPERHVCVPQIERLSTLPKAFESTAELVHDRLYDGLELGDGPFGEEGVE